MVYTYKGMLFNLKTEENPAIRDNMDELWAHYIKWNKAVPEGQILPDSTYIRNLK